MSLEVNWANPYEDRQGKWLKGNLHAHSSPVSPCGKIPTDQLLAAYAKCGYDFLSLSEHRTLSCPANETNLTLIPGMEWNTPGDEKHTGIYSADPELIRPLMDIATQAQLLGDLAGRDDALVILAHPNYQSIPHYRREELAAAGPYDGIEIYNFTIERLPGAALATDKWDYLLEKDIRVLGFASDDTHYDYEIAKAWICVRSESRSAEGIISALQKGNFYCAAGDGAESGVEILDITRTGRQITVETANAEQVHAITGGSVVQRVIGSSITYDIPDPAPAYVRFEAFGAGLARAWTQPFFLSS